MASPRSEGVAILTPPSELADPFGDHLITLVASAWLLGPRSQARSPWLERSARGPRGAPLFAFAHVGAPWGDLALLSLIIDAPAYIWARSRPCMYARLGMIKVANLKSSKPFDHLTLNWTFYLVC